jgi:hypothetical protein
MRVTALDPTCHWPEIAKDDPKTEAQTKQCVVVHARALSPLVPDIILQRQYRRLGEPPSE